MAYSIVNTQVMNLEELLTAPSCSSLCCVPLYSNSLDTVVPSNWFSSIDAARTYITEDTCHMIATEPVHWRTRCCLAMVLAWTYRKHIT
jgi:hypothetical protein